MAKDNTLIIVVVLVFAILLFKMGSFSFSIFPITNPVLTQYTARPTFSNGVFDSSYPASGIYFQNVKFSSNSNYLEFKTETSSMVMKPYCLSLSTINPKEGMVSEPIYIDDDGCQHWSYSVPQIDRNYYTCDGGSTCENYYGGSECSPYGYCYNPHDCFPAICYTPMNPIYWIYHPTQYGEEDSDFGGVIYSTADPITGLINYGCYEEINVYMDGLLVDTLNASTPPSEIYALDNDLNIKVDKMVGSWSVGYDCKAASNNYQFLFPESSIDVEIGNLSGSYSTGDEIILDIEINNNLTNLYSNLILNFKVNGISSEVEKNINLVSGKNEIQMEIPSNIALPLEITPEIELFYPTEGMEGVSLNKKDIQAIDYISIGKQTFETIIIDINQACKTGADVDCNGQISRGELGDYAMKWIYNQVNRQELSNVIQAWAL